MRSPLSPSEAEIVERVFALSGKLQDVSKFRWGLSIAAGYVAILAFPFVAIITDFPLWVGTLIAAASSVFGKFLRWRAGSLRLDAEDLHRTAEYSRGLGQTVDRKLLADLTAKYNRLNKRTPTERPSLQYYYDIDEPPSQTTLLKMLRESSWWTEKLSSKMTRWIGWATAVVLAAVSFLVFSKPSTEHIIDPKIYGLVFCVIFSLDIIYLFWRFRQLSEAAGKSYRQFHTLLNSSDVSDRDALIAAANYQFSRSSAPPLPTWLWKINRKSLNTIWKQTLSTQ